MDWVLREPPLEPVGAVGFGEVARRLARTLLDRSPGGLRGAAGEDVLLVVGPDLPWVDGLVWLGRDPRAPTLLMPTTREPSVHPALLARRLGPCALTLDPARQLPLDALAPLHLPALRDWLEEA